LEPQQFSVNLLNRSAVLAHPTDAFASKKENTHDTFAMATTRGR
jgi:hypothetical protein